MSLLIIVTVSNVKTKFKAFFCILFSNKLYLPTYLYKASLVAQMIKNLVALVVRSLPANAGDIRHEGLIPKSGRFTEGGHGNPLQYSCLENPNDTGAWQAPVHRIAQSWTGLKRLSRHAET